MNIITGLVGWVGGDRGWEVHHMVKMTLTQNTAGKTEEGMHWPATRGLGWPLNILYMKSIQGIWARFYWKLGIWKLLKWFTRGSLWGSLRGSPLRVRRGCWVVISWSRCPQDHSSQLECLHPLPFLSWAFTPCWQHPYVLKAFVTNWFYN